MTKRARDCSSEYKWDKKLEKYVPKASPLSYTLFMKERSDYYHKVVADGEKKLSAKQISRKVRSDWIHLDEVEKKKYQATVDKEKTRAEKQKKELEDKGFFTLSNGVKSTDLPPPESATLKKRSSTPMKAETKKAGSKKK